MFVSEIVATFGLLAVIWGCTRAGSSRTPYAVSAYIVGAYWFTPSTSFANPAVTIARAADPIRSPGFVRAMSLSSSSRKCSARAWRRLSSLTCSRTRRSCVFVRDASSDDVADIGRIYNEGIADRVATLEEDPKDAGRYGCVVGGTRRAIRGARRGDATGWRRRMGRPLNRYENACSMAGIADLSVYVGRAARGNGVGVALLAALERRAENERISQDHSFRAYEERTRSRSV